MAGISVVVPTLCEAENIRELHARLARVLADEDWEVVFVDDDSPDGTADVVRSLSQCDPHVRLIQRRGRRGVSSAVAEGALSTSSPIIAVMDGDLQHDETILPRLIHELRSRELDIAIGSRYVDGGDTGIWQPRSKLLSRLGAQLARGLVPSELRDPMSGYFVVRGSVMRETARRLSRIGYKVLLDLFASADRPLRYTEVPYTFRRRIHGSSKLDSLIAWEYLMLVADKRFGRVLPPRLLLYAIVGAPGVVAHYAFLAVLFVGLGVPFTLAQAVASAAGMTSNFILNNLFTYRDKRLHGLALVHGLVSFYAVCSLGALANIGVATFAFALQTQWALSAAVGIVVGTLWNYFATSRLTWRAGRADGA